MREYYAKQLTEMLHDLQEGPFDLPWAIYREGIFTDIWVADCTSKRVAQILVNALSEEEIKIENNKKPEKKIILP